MCAIYYRGPKATNKTLLFDHIAESYHLLTAKYGSKLQFIIAGDTNRLNLSPILALSPHFKQVVTVPTRLNPDAILDIIITSMSKFYQAPVTKPPINNNVDNGKPSDHLVVVMEPITSALECPPRVYRTVQYRPLTDSGFMMFEEWLAVQTWAEIYRETNCHKKAEIFQQILVNKYLNVFPMKTMKVCDEDRPWFSKSLKLLDRKRKREFQKHKQSMKWKKINEEFEKKCEVEMKNYYENIVQDLKESNTGQWYSKVKRMAGQEDNRGEIVTVEELIGYSDDQQAEIIADHYAAISNLYEPVRNEHFSQYLDSTNEKPPNIGPYKVFKTIKKMNQKCATVKGDIPMKLIVTFADEMTLPLTHIIHSCLQNGVYPNLWKHEIITPAPKVYPPEKLKHLRKISGLVNFSKITDSILSEFLVADMDPTCDKAQYGNVKGLSVQHYLIKMLHQILLKLDTNNQSESFAVIMSMIDWSQAFDRQSHKLGIQSFIDNGVRPSLIPILLSFFQDRTMQVKWNGKFSSAKHLPGGGPQGGTLGIIEYKSQSDDNTDFLNIDEKYKYIDDLSIIELINLILNGIASYNSKQQVPSDIGIGHKFIHSENFKTQTYLNNISEWTEQNQMKLNTDKSNYMIFNFSKNYQFNTRLYLKDSLMQQVRQTRLLGVIVSDNLSWHANTANLVKRCYQRMIILKKLYKFSVPVEELVNIYCLYIRSVAEQSSVVWSSSLTVGQNYDLERVQKVALRIILGDEYSSYENALKLTGLVNLQARRSALSLNFAKKCIKNERARDMFPLKPDTNLNTRRKEKYKVTKCRTGRLAKSAIPSMQAQLNLNARKKN